MNLIGTIKAFFIGPKGDPSAVAANNAFSAAGDICEDASCAIEPYTKCANHRFAILEAEYALSKAPSDDDSAADVYDKAVAAYTDQADFEPYTEAYLDEHTAAFDAVSAAFNNLTAAFVALNPTDNLYPTATELYAAHRNLCVFAVTAYSKAAQCAMTTALEGNLQAAKDNFKVLLHENMAANAAAIDVVAAKSKAAVFKAQTAEHATKAKRLELKARTAENKAEVFLEKTRA